MIQTKILYLFTRTPLHVGAGASVGAIDQPIVRERHTGFPVIPGTSLKGTFADAWNGDLRSQGETRNLRVTTKMVESKEQLDEVTDAAWLFGSDNAAHSFAGALQFSEARLLAFPIRSARGSFAWITSPLVLQRALRDGVFDSDTSVFKDAKANIQALAEPDDSQAIVSEGKLDLSVVEDGKTVKKVVLEEYTFTRAGNDEAGRLGEALSKLLDDPVWKEVASRLIILSNGMLSFFVQNACEVGQHVRINDETGTAAGGALFNQENVPSEAMFYSVLHAFDERTPRTTEDVKRKAGQAIESFRQMVDGKVFQFGGDASTGLGYCTVKMNPLNTEVAK